MSQCGSPLLFTNVDLDTVSTGLQHLFDSPHARCNGSSLQPTSIHAPAECNCSLTRSSCLSEPAHACVGFVHKRVCMQQILYVTDLLV